ncbi:MAG: cell division protein FtsL [Gammaproteobacteria bacterium]
MFRVILVFAVIASALGVVYQNHRCRDLFMEIQRLETELDNSEIESGQLQLERTTQAGYGRVESAATSKIGLVRPGRDAIVYLKNSSAEGAESDD